MKNCGRAEEKEFDGIGRGSLGSEKRSRVKGGGESIHRKTSSKNA